MLRGANMVAAATSQLFRFFDAFNMGPIIKAHDQMQQAAAEHHFPKLRSIETEMVQVGQEQAQLENLIRRADKALYAIDQWKGSGRRVFLGKELFKNGIAEHFANLGIEVLRFWLEAAAESKDLRRISKDVRGSIVLLNSNDLLGHEKIQLLRELYKSCPKTLFVVWVWDNHHMVTYSAMIGLSVDVQYPAHHDNLHILNRFCPFVRTPLPAACNTWTKAQARRFGEDLAAAVRPVRLSGAFTYHPQFGHRNITVHSTMQQKIGRNLKMRKPGDYHNLMPEECWNEWMSSKVNLVVPTLSDLPIRFFDALLTGNIPLIPRNLAHVFTGMDQAIIRELPIMWFDYADLPDMASLVKKACNEFDKEGADGILRRHHYALNNHMIEDRIESILEDIIGLGSRSGP